MNKQLLFLLENISELSILKTILNTFIPAFIKFSRKKGKMYYLYGKYRLPSTISARPSCSDPNLLNLPSSGTPLAKPVKKCFQAPIGRLIVGADYKSQEHKANALITKDPNMLAEYAQGIDGHSMRAFAYFKDEFPKDFIKKVNKAKKTDKKLYAKLLNSIADLYTELRQKGKSPTFLLQFKGTIYGLMRKFGFSKKVAKAIIDNFMLLYIVSVNWTNKQIKKAHKKGYVTGAFNLRLQTPILKQTVYGSSTLPKAAQQEARSAGNMISGQSYGLLTIRAFAEFMFRIRKSKKWKLQIAPWACIYDAIYLEIPSTVEALLYVNKNLINDMENIKGCPELEHPIVKMGANLCIYYPDWSNEIKLPNNISRKELIKILKKNNIPYK